MSTQKQFRIRGHFYVIRCMGLEVGLRTPTQSIR